MMLGELITYLEKRDPSKPVPDGFGTPESYRGYYDQVSFRPKKDTTIGEMLAHARSAVGATFTGYKGGEYTMGKHTDCWLADYGDCGDEICEVMLRHMVGECQPPDPHAGCVPREKVERLVKAVFDDDCQSLPHIGCGLAAAIRECGL